MIDLYPPKSSSHREDAQFWTYDMVEARLVETVQLWWRMPGGGRWPFASDGPWHLIRAEWGDYADAEAVLRSLPLRRAEIAAMEEATEWLTGGDDDAKRRVLVLALIERAKGKKQVGWSATRDALREPALTGAA